jgi:hypothetical protein
MKIGGNHGVDPGFPADFRLENSRKPRTIGAGIGK